MSWFISKRRMWERLNRLETRQLELEKLNHDTSADIVRQSYLLEGLGHTADALRRAHATQITRVKAFEKLIEWKERTPDCFLASVDGDYLTPMIYSECSKQVSISTHDEAMRFGYVLGWQSDGYAIYACEDSKPDG